MSFRSSVKLSFGCSLLFALGCEELVRDPNYPPSNQCPTVQTDLAVTCTLPDLATPQPKCAAAKGLSGDTLHCVDFKTLPDQTLTATPPAELPNWSFANGTNCWQIASGKLQVKNFGTFVGTCSFTMPLTDLAGAANQKYQSVTLAVVQKVEINTVPIVNKNQTTQVFLGLAMPTLQLSSYTGSNPRQQTTHAITRTDLLTVRGDASFQPLFQLSSAAAFSGSGWQIESIAVMGNP